MDQTTMKKIVKSNHDFPTEIWLQILSLIPVISLLRFRCVSKSWRSMIDDPDFCRLHLQLFPYNQRQAYLLVVDNEGSPDCTFRLKTDLTSPGILCRPPTPNIGSWTVHSSIDGLVMLQEYPEFNDEPMLALWNPSIRKSLVLPPLPRHLRRMHYLDLGFGFDPSINDYKHVKVARNGTNSMAVAIYTVGLGSWKIVPFKSKGCSRNWMSIRVGIPCPLRGRLYFIALKGYTLKEELVSLDLINEVFTSIELPRPYILCLTVVNGACLFVGQEAHHRRKASVWRLENRVTDSEESICWTKCYLVGIGQTGNHTLRPIKSDGRILEIDASLLGEPKLEDSLEAREERRLIQILDPQFDTEEFFEYSESLVWPK